MVISVNSTLSSPLQSIARSSPLEKISSGLRINRASDDGAGQAIAERLGREVDGLSVAVRNAGDAASYAQVGSGGLENLRNDFGRLRELSLQAANGTLNASDRAALQEEADQVQGSIQQTLQGTRFNGRSLFDSDEDVTFQVGTREGDTLRLSDLNLNRQLEETGALSINLGNSQAASAAVGRIDAGLEKINATDAGLGAVSNRLESVVAEAGSRQEAAAASRSRIRDTDFAREASELISGQIREQAERAVQTQANGQSRYVLSLLS